MNQNANNVQELGSDRPDEFLEDAKYFLKVTYSSTLKIIEHPNDAHVLQ